MVGSSFQSVLPGDFKEYLLTFMFIIVTSVSHFEKKCFGFIGSKRNSRMLESVLNTGIICDSLHLGKEG